MPDLGTQIGAARQAGYSDADITAYLAKDPSYGPKVAQAKAAGYSDAEIAGHLADAPPPSENVFQKAARLTGEAFTNASASYRNDMAAAKAKMTAGQSPSLMDEARPVLDAASAAFSPIKGIADATFGDKPVALPFGINSKGLTGGDIATMAIPVGGEVAATAKTAQFAKDAGITARTAEQTLAASKAPVSIAAPNPTPTNALADKVQAFDQAGVRPTLAAVSPGAAKTAKFVSENALAGGKTTANLQASLDDTSQAVGRAAQSYGTPAARGAAGEAVQQGIQDFNQRFSERADAMYTPVFNKLDTAQAIASQQTKTAADLATAKGAAPVAAQPVINPDATAQVLGDITGRGNSPALRDLFSTPQVQKLTAAVQDPASLSFQDLRNARTWVRNAQSDDTLRQGISQSDLQRLEGALTQDINANAANIGGPKVARQLQQADQFYRLGSQRIQGALQRFVGRSGDASGESAYDMIQRMASDKGGADAGRLLALKNSLKPSEWGDVSASVINRMGQLGTDNSFSVNKFVTAMDNMSPQGKDLVFGKGDLRSSLDNLLKVARMQKGVEQAANHSNTAVAGQVAAMAGSVPAVVGTALSGHPIAAAAMGASGALGLAGLHVTGDIMTNPAAVRWLANLGKAEKTSPAAVSSALGRLKAQSALNPALVPVYAEAARAFGTPALPAAATTTSPAQSTPAPNN